MLYKNQKIIFMKHIFDYNMSLRNFVLSLQSYN